MAAPIPCGMAPIPPLMIQPIAAAVLEAFAMMNKEAPCLHPRRNMLALISYMARRTKRSQFLLIVIV